MRFTMFSPLPVLSTYSGIPARFRLRVTIASAPQISIKHRRPREPENSRSLRLSNIMSAIISGTISPILIR
ncbi:hypothetical protein D3C72_1428190 [compost metagenome]